MPTPTEQRLSALRSAVEHALPHPDLSELIASANSVRDWALADHRNLPDQSVGGFASPEQLADLLASDPPDSGRPFEDVLADFDRSIAPFVIRTSHPRFLAFVPGAPAFPSILGDWLTSAANYFAGVWLEASGPTQIETIVLDWFRRWMGMPASTLGVLLSGGSEANLTALVVARNHVPHENHARLVLYVCEQRHWSVDRAAKVMGIHANQIHSVPVGHDYRMRGAELARTIQADRSRGLIPWAAVANAGATNTGTIDALDEIAGVCKLEKVWLHVDAAYGWAGVLGQCDTKELAAMGAADSVAFDPHKWFAQTFESGGLLVREGNRLAETFALRPDYMQDVEPRPGEINYADHGISLSRRFRALKVWMSVQVLGLDWFRLLVDHCSGLAEYAQARLERSGCFQILCPRRLSIVCFRYFPSRFVPDLDELNEQLVAELTRSGSAFLSSTRLRSKFALRMCFVNWRTTAADVDRIVDLLEKLGADLADRSEDTE